MNVQLTAGLFPLDLRGCFSVLVRSGPYLAHPLVRGGAKHCQGDLDGWADAAVAQPCLSKACHERIGDLEQSRYVESPFCRATQIL
jgi:hypothetical protein